MPTRDELRAARKRSFVRATDKAGKSLVPALEKFLKRVTLDEADRILRQRLGIGLEVSKAFSREDDAELQRLLEAFGLRQIATVGSTVAETFGARWIMPPATELEFIQSKAVQVKRLSDSTRRIVERTVRAALEDALTASARGMKAPSLADIARQVRQALVRGGEVQGEPLRRRAELIARTEAAQAQNAGIVAGARVAGVEFMEWVAILDSRTRDSHRHADGQVRRVGALFDVGGTGMRFPGDPRAPIAELANCRCTVIPSRGPERG